ncbi:MAG: peptidoglycan-binding domain-containing protein [Paracoccaceae bacterium]
MRTKMMLNAMLLASAAAIATLAGAHAQQARPVAASADLPPNAKAGECYARIMIPAQYRTVNETVVVTPASQKIETVAARYEWIEERVTVKEASERLEIIPARYEDRTERVMVRPGSEKLIVEPAKFNTVEEKVLVKPAYTTWKKGRGPIEKVDDSTGDIMCLVEVPAEYKTVTKRVMASAETTRKEVIPAEYTNVTKRVMVEPPKTTKVVIPAEYKMVRVQKLVEPAREVRTPIPAVTQQVTRQEKINDAKLEWRSILCETNTRPDLLVDLQKALQARGFNPGRMDGRLGADTMAAVQAFQRSRNMATGQLTMETLAALNVKVTN